MAAFPFLLSMLLETLGKTNTTIVIPILCLGIWNTNTNKLTCVCKVAA